MATIRNRYQSTTVRLPREIFEQAKIAIKRSEAASSFNDFVVQAIQEKVYKLTESQIDDAFARMSDDPQYQRESVAMAFAFEKSDWEALKSTEIAHERADGKARTSKTSSR
jgi:hypothetical protein